jgi:glycosyltransferase involved in cell wall biosynthesis
MKLLYITNGINASGGLERVLSIKASYLADHYDYEVTILSLNDNQLNPFYDFSDKIKMLSIPVTGNPLQYINLYCNGLKQIVNQIKPDVVSVCDDGLKGFFVPKIIRGRIPIIYERHASINLNFKRESSNLVFSIKNIIKYALMKRAAIKFKKFIVLTKGNLKEWKGDNLRVIANPLSFYTDVFASLEEKRVIVVGSHGFNKGYDLLLLAWKNVAEKYQDWNLEIYGKIDNNGTYQNQAEALGLKNSVTFFNPVKDIQNKYLRSSIMILPSRSEGFGMVLIEAMACGVPCVSFDCPQGPADIIQNGVDGFLVENGNTQELASKIIKLIEEKNLRKQMGAKAKQNVKRYLPEVIVKQWDELFKSLVH